MSNFPKFKKEVKDFLSSEDGRITKQNAFILGATLLGGALINSKDSEGLGLEHNSNYTPHAAYFATAQGDSSVYMATDHSNHSTHSTHSTHSNCSTNPIVCPLSTRNALEQYEGYTVSYSELYHDGGVKTLSYGNWYENYQEYENWLYSKYREEYECNSWSENNLAFEYNDGEEQDLFYRVYNNQEYDISCVHYTDSDENAVLLNKYYHGTHGSHSSGW